MASMPRCLPAFSLIEMMIAIVILGLGLVMTATMFPVAWTRARTLTEFTTQRAVAESAAASLQNSLRAAGSELIPIDKAVGIQKLSGGSLAGDLFYDSVRHTDPQYVLPCVNANACFTHRSVLLPSDTRVHALNMENFRIQVPSGDNPVAPENPWIVERNDPWRLGSTTDIRSSSYPLSDYPAFLADTFSAASFYSAQVTLGARLYPPSEPLPADPAARSLWEQQFSAKRYAWGALHRLKKHVGPDDVAVRQVVSGTIAQKREFAAHAADFAGTTRIVDFYLVTLRRSQSSNRYAIQDPAFAPDPHDRETLVVPRPLRAEEDVALPIPWRVQIQLPTTGLKSRAVPDDDPNADTGIPTEVTASALVRGMFPAGTQFVDEVNGQIYRVTRHRFSADDPPMGILTLDREITVEDVDDSDLYPGDFQLTPDELLRAVWVYPPPVDRSVDVGAGAVVFDGASPVIGMDVQTLSLTPPG